MTGRWPEANAHLVWEALEEEERVYELECSRSRAKLTLCRGGSSLKFVTINLPCHWLDPTSATGTGPCLGGIWR